MDNTALYILLATFFTLYTGSTAAYVAGAADGSFAVQDAACIPLVPVLLVSADGTLDVDPCGCWAQDARLVQLQDFARGYNESH